MDGESVSDKVRRCIIALDADADLVLQAKENHIAALKKQREKLVRLLKSVGWKGEL